MEPYIAKLADFLRLHIASVSVGLVATLLAIYGRTINSAAQKLTKGFPFIGRFAFFVALCGFGYALLSSQIVRLLRHQLVKLSDMKLVIVTTAAFLILAFLAKSTKSLK